MEFTWARRSWLAVAGNRPYHYGFFGIIRLTSDSVRELALKGQEIVFSPLDRLDSLEAIIEGSWSPGIMGHKIKVSAL